MKEILEFDNLREGFLTKNRNFKKFNFSVIYSLLCLYQKETKKDTFENSLKEIVDKFTETNRQKLVDGKLTIISLHFDVIYLSLTSH